MENTFEELIENMKVENKIKRAYKKCAGTYRIIDKLLNHYKIVYYDKEITRVNDSGHEHFLTKETEDKILELIDEDDDVLLIQDKKSLENIGMRAVELGLKRVVMRSLDNEIAGCQQCLVSKDTIGMRAARFRQEDCVLKALDNKNASLIQDEFGQNLGMICAELDMVEATLKALDNHEASLQQDKSGENIGLICMCRGLDDCVVKALDNKEAMLQQNNENCNMKYYLSYHHGVVNSLPKAVEKFHKIELEDSKANLNNTLEEFRGSFKDIDEMVI